MVYFIVSYHFKQAEHILHVEKFTRRKKTERKLIDSLINFPRGYSQKSWVGVCGPLPKTLNIFMTKICGFHYPIFDLTLFQTCLN